MGAKGQNSLVPGWPQLESICQNSIAQDKTHQWEKCQQNLMLFTMVFDPSL